MRDVAEAAGVSVATVSRVLTGHGDLSESTRTAVHEAARTLGYARTSQHRGRPRTTDSRLIELVIGRFDTGWAERAVVGAREAATALNYDLVLTAERDDPDDDWLRRVVARRSSGVILGLIRPTADQLRRLENLAIPVVLIDPMSAPAGGTPSIGSTDFEGGVAAGHLLAAAGLRRFIVVAGTPRFRFGRAREAGFRSAVLESVPDAQIEVVDAQWQFEEVPGPFARKVAATDMPVGVFALNDQMALGVYAVADRLGLRIPEDLSVVGFDDDPASSRLQPGLTTLRPQHRAMGAGAVRLLHDLMQGRVEPSTRIELPTELVRRGSA